MRILLVNGAYRRDGVTKELLDLFASGCAAEGATLDTVDLKSHKIKNCLGCFECYSEPDKGVCVHKDDMTDLIERFYKSDGLVLASPVYFYSMSATMKQFIERLFPLTQPKHVANPEDGLVYNAPRDTTRGPQKAVLIAPFAHRQVETVDSLVGMFEKTVRGLGASPAGTLLRPESNFMDFEASKPKTLRRIHLAFEKAGMEFAKNGFVSNDTELQASNPLSFDPETFSRHCEAYWEILSESDIKVGDREAIRRVAVEDLRLLIPELENRFDPRAAGKTRAKILFELSGVSPQVWSVLIGEGKCKVLKGFIDDPDLSIKAKSETIVDMIMRRIDLRRAIAQKEIKLDGDKSLFTRFGRFFPPKSA